MGGRSLEKPPGQASGKSQSLVLPTLSRVSRVSQAPAQERVAGPVTSQRQGGGLAAASADPGRTQVDSVMFEL